MKNGGSYGVIRSGDVGSSVVESSRGGKEGGGAVVVSRGPVDYAGDGKDGER